MSESNGKAMTNVERAVLEYLAARSSTAHTAARAADWLELPIPRVVAALRLLASRRYVTYYIDASKHGGTWALARGGRAYLEGSDPLAGRYKMALEAILETSHFDAPKIAQKALRHG